MSSLFGFLDSSNFRCNAIVLAIISILGFLAYGNSFDVPFYYDDYHVILQREVIKSLENSFWGIYDSRGVALFSFAVNYFFSEFDVWSYHFLNLIFHIATSFFVFLLVERVSSPRRGVAFFVALIFLLHPVQTQAVTYITQRMAILACLFSLGAILLYLSAWRAKGGRRSLLYLGATAAAVLALLSKEHVVVLPALLVLVIWCHDISAFKFRKAVFFALPLTIVISLVVLSVFLPSVVLVKENQMVRGGSAERHTRGVELFYYADEAQTQIESALASQIPDARLRYLATELRVLGKYWQLFLYPKDQALDYSWPLVSTVWTFKTFALLLLLAGGLVVAYCLRNRRPLVLFSLLWILLGLLVESSIIPLDPIFEHRMYLPLPGFALLVQQGGEAVLSQRNLTILATGILLVLLVLTVGRNDDWRDPVAFWEDNLRQAPYSFRVTAGLAQAYVEGGREGETLALLEPFYATPPWPGLYHNDLYFNNLIELGKAYYRRGLIAKAQELFERGARWYPQKADPLLYLALLAQDSGNNRLARGYLEKARRLAPLDPAVQAASKAIH